MHINHCFLHGLRAFTRRDRHNDRFRVDANTFASKSNSANINFHAPAD